MQAVNAQEYAERATRELTRTATLPAPRGEITDRNGNVLARSIESIDLVVDQTLINRPDRAAEIVAPIIGESISYVKSRLVGTRKFVYVARDITPAQWKSVKAAIANENGSFRNGLVDSLVSAASNEIIQRSISLPHYLAS